MSLRNSLHRRNHKERSQLAHRSRLGILEKHKDYVKRARDFHSKQNRIKRLKEKAAERNKDEFYFGMIRSKTEEGVHVKSRGNTSLPTDMVKVLKSQDGNYVRAVRQTGLKKIDKLKAQLSALADLMTPGKVGAGEGTDAEDALDKEELEVLQQAGIVPSAKSSRKGRRKSSGSSSKHVVFVSNDEEARNYHPPRARCGPQPPNSSRVQDNDLDSPVDLGWEWPEDKLSQKKLKGTAGGDHVDDAQGSYELDERKQAAVAHRRQLLKELAARLKRDVNLRYAARELEMQRLMMGKGAARKIRGVEKVEEEEEEKDDEDDEDASDFRKGKRRKVDVGMEEKTYRPRVYKWRAERKK